MESVTLRNFDRFMDSHPDISAQVRQKPWLVTNYDFLQSHPDLKSFLQNHPQLNNELGQNPVAFMQEENLVDRPEGRRDDAAFNQFMNGHREIAEQIRKNPSLMNDRDFQRNHPALQTFLQQNPGVRDEMRQNPNAFTMHEQSTDNRDFAADRDADARRTDDDARRRDPDARRTDDDSRRRDADARRTDDDSRRGDQDARDRAANGADRDNERKDKDQFDRFLDGHREIAEQVRKDPSLVNDRKFVQNHPDLQAYVQSNPGLRQDVKQDPDAFKQEDNRYDRTGYGNGRDLSHQHMAEFGGFLGGHSDIAKDVTKNPSVVKNHEYVQQHPELSAYLNAHPDVRNEWMANPASFVKGAQQVTATGSTTGSAGTTGSGSGTSGSGTTAPSPAATPTNKPK